MRENGPMQTPPLFLQSSSRLTFLNWSVVVTFYLPVQGLSAHAVCFRSLFAISFSYADFCKQAESFSPSPASKISTSRFSPTSKISNFTFFPQRPIIFLQLPLSTALFSLCSMKWRKPASKRIRGGWPTTRTNRSEFFPLLFRSPLHFSSSLTMILSLPPFLHCHEKSACLATWV